MTEIRIDPVIPGWAIVILIILALAGMWLTFRRCLLPLGHRLLVGALRLAAILVLGGLLLQPELLRVRTEEEDPTLAVLIDSSASMLDSPNRNAEVRRQTVRDLLNSRRFRAGIKRYKVKWFQFGAELEDAADPHERAITYNAPRSHLVKAVNAIVQRSRGENLAGVVLLTDGLDQSTQDLLPGAVQVPLFIPELETVETRTRKQTGEMFIADLTHPQMLVVNWKGQVNVVVKRSAAGGRVPCPVKLFRGTELVRSGTLLFEAEDTVKTQSFTIEPTTVGRVTYLLEIHPGVDRRKDNNRRQFAVDVTDPKNRILYIDGNLRWEFKYVKRALLKEKNYQVSAFVQNGPGVFVNFSEGAQSAQVADMPELSDASTLKFRALILGEMEASALTAAQQQTVARYVEKGGGLLFLGAGKAYGKDGWPASETMARMLPFSNEGKRPRMADGRFRIASTAQGRTHPILTGVNAPGGFPEILSIWGRVRKKPDATVLLEGPDGAPVLLVKRYGKGKVAALLTDSLWRWQLGQAKLDEGKSLYEQFIGQIVYWLSPQKKELDESTNLQVVTASAQAEVRQRVAVGAVSGEGGAKLKLACRITTPDNRTLSFDMVPAKLAQDVGLTDAVWGWRSEFTPHVPGNYEIIVREKASGEQAGTKLLVIEPQLEKTGKPINRSLLKSLARRTGGKFYPHDRADRLMPDIPHQPLKVTTTTEKPIWNKAWILGLLIAVFSFEWYIRSKLDLV